MATHPDASALSCNPLEILSRALGRCVAVIYLPWPDWGLSPNKTKGSHWAPVNDLRSIARIAGQDAARDWHNVIGRGATVTAVILWEPPDNRWRDDDNLIGALKSYRDGVADAIGFNDRQIMNSVMLRQPAIPQGKVTLELWVAR